MVVAIRVTCLDRVDCILHPWDTNMLLYLCDDLAGRWRLALRATNPSRSDRDDQQTRKRTQNSGEHSISPCICGNADCNPIHGRRGAASYPHEAALRRVFANGSHRNFALSSLPVWQNVITL